MPYNCLYQNKGNNSSVKGSILTKLMGYRESMVLIFVPRMNQTWPIGTEIWFWTDKKCGRDGWTDGRMDGAKTIPPTLLGDKKVLMTNASLMKVKSIAECSPWSILQYFWPALSDNWSWKPVFCLFEGDPFTQVLLYSYTSAAGSQECICQYIKNVWQQTTKTRVYYNSTAG